MKVQLKFKNEVYENYFIDENGVIYDLNNTPQKTSIYQGRPRFKKIAIHRFVMHSFKGYREGMDIHHLNEDKFDNRLENLVYLTRSQHVSYHAANRNEETKKKISFANKNAGRIWVNNCSINKFVYPDQIPEGFIRGRI